MCLMDYRVYILYAPAASLLMHLCSMKALEVVDKPAQELLLLHFLPAAFLPFP